MMKIVDAINCRLVAGLAEAGYPPLEKLLADASGVYPPGRILVGNRHVFGQYTPPRVIMLPVSSTFGPRDTTRGPVPVAGNLTGYDAESRVSTGVRAIFTDAVRFEVSCWSISPEGVPEADAELLDWDYTQALAHLFIASCQGVMPGCFRIEGGTWRDVAHQRRVGREFVFDLTVGVPILDTLPPLDAPPGLLRAPAGVQPVISDTFTLPSGASGPGCEP